MILRMEKIVRLTVRILTAAAVCIAVSGCMVSPDYKRPQTAADTAEGYIYAGRHRQDINEVASQCPTEAIKIEG